MKKLLLAAFILLASTFTFAQEVPEWVVSASSMNIAKVAEDLNIDRNENKLFLIQLKMKKCDDIESAVKIEAMRQLCSMISRQFSQQEINSNPSSAYVAKKVSFSNFFTEARSANPGNSDEFNFNSSSENNFQNVFYEYVADSTNYYPVRAGTEKKVIDFTETNSKKIFKAWSKLSPTIAVNLEIADSAALYMKTISEKPSKKSVYNTALKKPVIVSVNKEPESYEYIMISAAVTFPVKLFNKAIENALEGKTLDPAVEVPESVHTAAIDFLSKQLQ